MGGRQQPAAHLDLYTEVVKAVSLKLSGVAEELALWALIKQAKVQLEIADEESDPDAWSDFREFVFDDKDFIWLYSPELDGISESEWGREHAIVNLRFS